MIPPALAVSVTVALFPLGPSAWEIDRATTLILCPELDAGPIGRRETAALMAAGQRLGLLGPDERVGFDGEYGFDAEPDGDAVLVVLRDLCVDLRNAPPLSDAARLPAPVDSYAAANFCRGLARGLRTRAAWEPDREAVLSAAAEVADAYAEFWLAAGQAAQQPAPVGDRRRCLAQLRDTVGPEAWAAGLLPDFAPMHLFRAR